MVAILSGAFGRKVLGSGPFTIGRKADNQLPVNNDVTVTSYHAEIRPAGQGYSIIDLNSKNGTFVNEQPIAPQQLHPLKPGDVIRIGDTRFTYEVTPDLDKTIIAPQSNLDNDQTGSRRLPQNPSASYEAPTVVAVPTPHPETQVLKMPPPNPSSVPTKPLTQPASNVTQPSPTQSAGPQTQPVSTQSPMSKRVFVPASPPKLSETLNELDQLIQEAENGNIGQHFPGTVADKIEKIANWKIQLRRTHECALLLRQPQFRLMDSQQEEAVCRHLAEAVRMLNFRREYTVTIVGHRGAGKTTLLGAMLGQDLFPRGQGGAVTGVRTRVLLCDPDDPKDTENLRIQFLTRSAFEKLIKKVRDELAKTTSANKQDALNTELQILLKAKEVGEKEGLLKEGEPHKKDFKREEWKDPRARVYIEEPNKGSSEPRYTRLVEFAEFKVKPSAGTQLHLPPRSVLVDLPGGGAAQPHHDDILREELNKIDAVIQLVDTKSVIDDDRSATILEEIQERVITPRRDETAEVVAHTVLFAVTHWDMNLQQGDRSRTTRTMNTLLSGALPPNYTTYHKHGVDETFFYKLRTPDAFFAALGIETRQSNSNIQQVFDKGLQEEAAHYVKRVGNVYEDLKLMQKNTANFLQTFDARSFQDITVEQHQAMLQYSGLPELTNDLQNFLTDNRYIVQLVQAKREVNAALRLIADFYSDQLRKLGFKSSQSQKVEEELREQQGKREGLLLDRLQNHIDKMHDAWEEALKQFRARAYREFPENLNTAYTQAKQYVEGRIRQGAFNEFIETNESLEDDPSRLETGLTSMRFQPLIDKLRAVFRIRMEREIESLASILARAFLGPIADKEAEGALDLQKIAFGEMDGKLAQIEADYKDIKVRISMMAHDICQYVIISALFDKTKYNLTGSEEVKALLKYVGQPITSNDTVHHDITQVLNRICLDLPTLVEDRTIRLFEYELRKLQAGARPERRKGKRGDPDAPDNGKFTDLVKTLEAELTSRFHKGGTLRQRLENLGTGEPDIKPWLDIIKKVEKLQSSVFAESV